MCPRGCVDAVARGWLLSEGEGVVRGGGCGADPPPSGDPKLLEAKLTCAEGPREKF